MLVPMKFDYDDPQIPHLQLVMGVVIPRTRLC